MPIVTCTWVGLIVSLLALGAAAPVPKQSSAEAEKIRKKLYGCWEEIEVVQNGVLNPSRYVMSAWKFTEKYTETMTLDGSAEMDRFPNGIRINTSTTPWQLDFVNDLSEPGRRRRYVCHGIFRFEGEHLVWVKESSGVSLDPGVEPSVNYKFRPKDFTSTAENKQTRIVLKKSVDRWFGE